MTVDQNICVCKPCSEGLGVENPCEQCCCLDGQVIGGDWWTVVVVGGVVIGWEMLAMAIAEVKVILHPHRPPHYTPTNNFNLNINFNNQYPRALRTCLATTWVRCALLAKPAVN